MAQCVSESGVRQHGSYGVLTASFMALFFNVGMGYAVGVFHVALLETFDADPKLTVWVGSTYFCMFALAGPLGSVIINLSSCRVCVVLSGILGLVGFSVNIFVRDIRWLFITYAFVAGTGTSLAHTGAIVVLGYHFKDKLSIMTGISISGIALGIFVYPPLCQILIDYYSLKGAFLICGAIVFNSSVCGMFMKPSKHETETHTQIISGRSKLQTILRVFLCNYSGIRKMITKKSYICFLTSCITFGMANSILYVYLPDYLQHRGITTQASAFGVSFTGIGSIVSRVLTGFAAHDERIGSALMFTSINGLMGILCLMIPLFSHSPQAVYIYGFFIGLYSGGIWSLFSPITVCILDIDMIATGFGVGMFVCGIGMMTGPPVAGNILEVSGDYYHLYVFSAAMFFTCSASFLFTTLFPLTETEIHSKRFSSSDIIEVEEVHNVVVDEDCGKT